jgi:uncharacterized protein
LQRFAEHRHMPWANGRGFTREVFALPDAQSWDWRLSIAEVTEDGPFSSLPGIDRVLCVATGKGLTLVVDGEPIELQRFETAKFSGDSLTICELTNGPVHDLNMMVRRSSHVGGARVEIKLLDRNEPIPQSDIENCLALVVLEGAVIVSTPGDGFPFNPVKVRASRLDALLPNGSPNAKRAALYSATQSVVALVFSSSVTHADSSPQCCSSAGKRK